MPKTSAGLLMYRRKPGLEVFLGHPGGPFWARRDLGAWTLPKGEVMPGEAPLEAARREFEEETGMVPQAETWIPLGEVRLGSGKIVMAWAFEGDWEDDRPLDGATFPLEWPRGSGRMVEFPEIDRVAWFSLDEARRRLLPAQVPFLDRLEAAIDS